MTQMIKAVALCTVLMMAATQIYGQKCKTKTDPITGETVRETDIFRITLHKYPRSQVSATVGRFSEKDGKYYFKTDINIVGDFREKMFQDDEYIIKLSDGKTVMLNPDKEIIPVGNVNRTGVWSTYNVIFHISKGDMQNISASKPEFIRISVSNKTKTYDADIYRGKRMSKAAQCMLE